MTPGWSPRWLLWRGHSGEGEEGIQCSWWRPQMKTLQLHQFYLPVKTNVNLSEARDFQVHRPMKSSAWTFPHGQQRTNPRTKTPGAPCWRTALQTQAILLFPSFALLEMSQHCLTLESPRKLLGNIRVNVIKITRQKQLQGERFIRLTVPGYSPSQKGSHGGKSLK